MYAVELNDYLEKMINPGKYFKGVFVYESEHLS